MSNTTNNTYHKTVIINRAVSGSGKTTITRCLKTALEAKGLRVGVHSTDEFFMQGSRYVFEVEKLNGFHQQNLENFIADLKAGVDIVICDNMNLLPWQSQPYTNAARASGYRILFINFAQRKLEEHLAAQVVTPEKPDAHGLTEELLERFIQNLNDYNALLNRDNARDPKKHHTFVWDNAQQKAMDTGELAPYYDLDFLIQVTPEIYEETQATIGEKVLKMISVKPENVKNNFDVIFHLFGEARLPILLALRQFRATRHIFVSTPRYPASSMQKFVPQNEIAEEISTDAFMPGATRGVLIQKIEKLKQKHGNGLKFGFNLTNGTKLMSFDALHVCNEVHGTPIYLESNSNHFIFLHDNTKEKAVAITNVEDFFRINGYHIMFDGKWTQEQNARRAFTLEMWGARGNAEPSGKKKLRIKGKELIMSDEATRGKYIFGGWFEEYCYMLFEELKTRKKITDIRIGLTISKDKNDSSPLQEFDVVFTDGRRLFIVECKKGKDVTSESVQKLSANLMTYGGTQCVGFMIIIDPNRQGLSGLRRRETQNLKIVLVENIQKTIREIEASLL